MTQSPPVRMISYRRLIPPKCSLPIYGAAPKNVFSASANSIKRRNNHSSIYREVGHSVAKCFLPLCYIDNDQDTYYHDYFVSATYGLVFYNILYSCGRGWYCGVTNKKFQMLKFRFYKNH